MGAKNNPGAFDCYEKAEPDEPMFVLLARDPQAPFLAEEWARGRLRLIDEGKKPEADRPMTEEAFACAKAMRDWRVKNRPEQR
jgi:hypothetical protein